MDVILMIVGLVALIAAWRMRGEAGEIGGGAVLLLVGGAVALVVGSVFFGVTFVDGFQRGLEQSQ